MLYTQCVEKYVSIDILYHSNKEIGLLWGNNQYLDLLIKVKMFLIFIK